MLYSKKNMFARENDLFGDFFCRIFVIQLIAKQVDFPVWNMLS